MTTVVHKLYTYSTSHTFVLPIYVLYEQYVGNKSTQVAYCTHPGQCFDVVQRVLGFEGVFALVEGHEATTWNGKQHIF